MHRLRRVRWAGMVFVLGPEAGVSCSVRGGWQELNYVDSVVPANLERWAVRWVLFLRETVSKRGNGMVVCSLLGRAWCCRS